VSGCCWSLFFLFLGRLFLLVPLICCCCCCSSGCVFLDGWGGSAGDGTGREEGGERGGGGGGARREKAGRGMAENVLACFIIKRKKCLRQWLNTFRYHYAPFII
jgi:hypothetical protein